VGCHIGVRFLEAMEDEHPARLALREAVREYDLGPPGVAA
jgi:hypothetical protein